MPIIIPAYIDEFLNGYVMDHNWFADKVDYERALEDPTGGIDYLPFQYGRSLPDPENPEQLLLIFCYGTSNLRYEEEAPARVETAIDELTKAHPEFATIPRRILIMGA